MADDNTPQGTVEQTAAPQDADSLLDRFLDGAPETENASAQETGQEAQGDAEQDDASQTEGQDQAEQQDGDQPQEPQYAADDAKVRLDDGTEVTIASLKQGSLRQADYTRKTQELSALRKELDQRQAAVAQQSQQFEAQVNLAIEIAAANLPAEPSPESMRDDPIGYMQQKALYDKRVQELQTLVSAKQQHEQAQVQQRQQAFQQYLGAEHQALTEAMPEMTDVAKRQAFGTDLAKALKQYGFSDRDLSQIYDHRILLAGRDLIAYQKLMAAKPKAIAKTNGKPPLSSSGNRQTPNAQKQAQKSADWKRLRESGGRDTDAFDRIVDDLI